MRRRLLIKALQAKRAKHIRGLTVLLLALALSMGNLVNAFGAETYPEVEISHPVSRAVQKYTGITLLSDWIGGIIARKALTNDLIDGRLNVRIRNFSATDLIGGRIKTLQLRGRDLVIGDILPVSHLTLKTDADSPIYVHHDDEPVLIRPVAMTLRMELDEADLNRFLAGDQARQKLTGIEVPLPPFRQPEKLDVLSSTVRFQDERITVASLVNIHGAPEENALPVEVSARIVPDGDEIQLDDVELAVEGIPRTHAVERFIEKNFDELLDLDRIRVQHHKLKFDFKTTEIADGKLVIEADVVVKPDTETRRRLVKFFQAKAE